MPPGLYLNDGGETASALSSALANIANNYSPKTQAEAAMLKLQMEGQNWQNRGLSDKTIATEAGINAAGQLPSALGAEIGKFAQPGGMAPGGASSDGNAAAVNGGPNMDPAARGQIRLSGGTIGDLIAGRYAQGAGIDEMRSGVEMGQQHNMGPANTYQAQGRIGEANAIADNAARNRVWEAGQTAPIDVWKATTTANQAPYVLDAGQAKHFPGVVSNIVNGTPPSAVAGAPPAAPAETVVSGPSIYDKSFQTGQADADVKAFDTMSQGGPSAQQGINKINDLQSVFAQLGNDTLGGRVSTALQQELLNRYGISVSDRGAAIAEVNNRIASMVGGIARRVRRARFAGPAITAISKSLAVRAARPARLQRRHQRRSRLISVQEAQGGGSRPAVQAGGMSASDGREAINRIYADDPMAKLRARHPSCSTRRRRRRRSADRQHSCRGATGSAGRSVRTCPTAASGPTRERRNNGRPRSLGRIQHAASPRPTASPTARPDPWSRFNPQAAAPAACSAGLGRHGSRRGATARRAASSTGVREFSSLAARPTSPTSVRPYLERAELIGRGRTAVTYSDALHGRDDDTALDDG